MAEPTPQGEAHLRGEAFAEFCGVISNLATQKM